MKAFVFSAFFLASSLLICSGQSFAPTPEWYYDYDVKFYKLDIEVDDASADVRGYADVLAEISVDGLQRFTLELAAAARVDSVRINGQRTSFSREGDLLFVHSPEPLSAGGMCTVTVFYAAAGIKGDAFFSAVTNRRDAQWDIPVTWTLSQPYSAKNWFPCKQYLPDKADSTHVFVTVPENLKAGAPGILTAVTPMPGGKARYEWKSRYPAAYYLISFAVADYQDYTFYAHPKGMNRPLPVQNFVYNRPGYLEKNKALIDTTAAIVELFSELFTPYPFASEKYGHCVAPMGGGMEHHTMTTISEFSFLLVVHEIAHMWFGNLVTCASFQDIWVNEGFSSYAEYLALEHLASPQEALAWLREAHSLASWSQGGSVFVPAESVDDPWRIFNMSLSYKKGALLVHKIRRIINDDSVFYDALRGFLNKYSFSVATAADFKKHLEERTGMDFTLFFDQWYYGEGFPVFDLSWRNADGHVEILLEHAGSSTATPLFVVDLDVRFQVSGSEFQVSGSDSVIQLPVRANRELFRIKTAGEVESVATDPGDYVLKQMASNDMVRDFPTDDRFVQCVKRVRRRQNLDVSFSAVTDRNCRVKLTDARGEKVFADLPVRRKRETTVPMEHLPNATYLLYVFNGKDTYVRKILKTLY